MSESSCLLHGRKMTSHDHDGMKSQDSHRDHTPVDQWTPFAGEKVDVSHSSCPLELSGYKWNLLIICYFLSCRLHWVSLITKHSFCHLDLCHRRGCDLPSSEQTLHCSHSVLTWRKKRSPCSSLWLCVPIFSSCAKFMNAKKMEILKRKLRNSYLFIFIYFIYFYLFIFHWRRR